MLGLPSVSVWGWEWGLPLGPVPPLGLVLLLGLASGPRLALSQQSEASPHPQGTTTDTPPAATPATQSQEISRYPYPLPERRCKNGCGGIGSVGWAVPLRSGRLGIIRFGHSSTIAANPVHLPFPAHAGFLSVIRIGSKPQLRRDRPLLLNAGTSTNFRTNPKSSLRTPVYRSTYRASRFEGRTSIHGANRAL